MKEKIINRLAEVNIREGFTLLYACESGSRAWGFPSPDSDYDVRFLYLRNADYYLSIDEKTDFINYPESETIDIEGWDLTKVLRLMRKSNTTVFEWLQSPICYSEKDNFRQELWMLAQNYFCAKSNMHHYLGIAKGAMETVINENTIKIKKLFYVLRPLLAAKWCFEKQGIAPMSIFPLLQLLPVHLREDISRLIVMKETASEGFVISIEPVLLNYLKSELQSCTDNVQQLEKVTADSKPLNNFFKKILQRYDY